MKHIYCSLFYHFHILLTSEDNKAGLRPLGPLVRAKWHLAMQESMTCGAQVTGRFWQVLQPTIPQFALVVKSGNGPFRVNLVSNSSGWLHQTVGRGHK